MIISIKINRFKSIIQDSISFSPLTVIVGANGTGKSNLIKALEFIGSIPRKGLAGTVNSEGGFQSILPKAVPKRELFTSTTLFDYTVQLPKYIYLPIDQPVLTVKHRIEIKHHPKNSARVVSEMLRFNGVLAVAAAAREKDASRSFAPPQESYDSHIDIEMGPRGAQTFSASPILNRDTVSAYLDWIGMSFARKGVTSKSSFLALIKNVVEATSSSSIPKLYSSFLDPRFPFLAKLADHSVAFTDTLRHLRRYDLLLNVLRDKQLSSESRWLLPDGKNLPSAMRHFLIDPEKKLSRDRFRETLQSISPHISSLISKRLRTGEEFIEFVEKQKGRGVESWESSDGSLRTVAILIALETQPRHSTILIEEPELNLHPWAIRILIDHIRNVITDRHLQVIMTSHSQQVLERLDQSEVLIATRTRDQGSKFSPLASMLQNSDIRMGEIGEMWIDGLLGGVPTYD